MVAQILRDAADAGMGIHGSALPGAQTFWAQAGLIPNEDRPLQMIGTPEQVKDLVKKGLPDIDELDSDKNAEAYLATLKGRTNG